MKRFLIGKTTDKLSSDPMSVLTKCWGVSPHAMSNRSACRVQRAIRQSPTSLHGLYPNKWTVTFTDWFCRNADTIMGTRQLPINRCNIIRVNLWWIICYIIYIRWKWLKILCEGLAETRTYKPNVVVCGMGQGEDHKIRTRLFYCHIYTFRPAQCGTHFIKDICQGMLTERVWLFIKLNWIITTKRIRINEHSWRQWHGIE